MIKHFQCLHVLLHIRAPYSRLFVLFDLHDVDTTDSMRLILIMSATDQIKN